MNKNQKTLERSTISEPEDEDDRLSSLPDSILIHIFSFLPTKQFIKSASFSKRFQFLWFSASSLIFNFNKDSLRSVYFMDFVATTLMFHNAPKIKKFSMTMNRYWTCRLNHVTIVNSWIRFAMMKSVQELWIQLSGTIYTLPKQLYMNDRVRILSFKGCGYNLPTSKISWGSLERLTITGCESITKQMIRRILDGCPKIVCFDVVDSYDPDRRCEVNHHYEYIRV